MSSLAVITGQNQSGGNLNCAYVSTDANGVETWKLWGSADAVNDATIEDDNGTLRFRDTQTSPVNATPNVGQYSVTSSSSQPSTPGTTSSTHLIPDGHYLHGWTSSGGTYKGYCQITYISGSGGGSGGNGGINPLGNSGSENPPKVFCNFW